jgi:hypothetical protein
MSRSATGTAIAVREFTHTERWDAFVPWFLSQCNGAWKAMPPRTEEVTCVRNEVNEVWSITARLLTGNPARVHVEFKVLPD